MTFSLGRLIMTAGFLELFSDSFLADKEAMILLTRHLQGDWGNLDREDCATNNRAVQEGNRILSSYTVHGQTIYVVTEADRSVTTILLESEN